MLRKSLLLLFLPVLFTSCERYQKIQDGYLQDRWTGKIYTYENRYGTDNQIHTVLVEVPQSN